MKWYEGSVHREVRCMNTLQTNDWLILNSIIYIQNLYDRRCRYYAGAVLRADEDGAGF